MQKAQIERALSCRRFFTVPLSLHEESKAIATERSIAFAHYVRKGMHLMDFASEKGFAAGRTHLITAYDSVPLPRLAAPLETTTARFEVTISARDERNLERFSELAHITPSERAARCLRLMQFLHLHDSLPNPYFQHEELEQQVFL
jgi:hypothetical protein